ncbi:hypothetical protein D3C71_318380 [compost metagenome]
MTDIRERPILFSGPMVRALLAGTKTQTRRIVKLPHSNPLGQWEPTTVGGPGVRYSDDTPAPIQAAMWHTRTGDGLFCPYGQPGDRLWVRETFVQGFPYDAGQDRLLQYDEGGNELPMQTWYRATDSDMRWADDDGWEANVPWRPSIHMPRWACRLVLDITSVRVERLQAISPLDAIAEGVGLNPSAADVTMTAPEGEALPRVMFRELWDRINGAGAWDANPWVWVVEFRALAHPANEHGGSNGHPA